MYENFMDEFVKESIKLGKSKKDQMIQRANEELEKTEQEIEAHRHLLIKKSKLKEVIRVLGGDGPKKKKPRFEVKQEFSEAFQEKISRLKIEIINFLKEVIDQESVTISILNENFSENKDIVPLAVKQLQEDQVISRKDSLNKEIIKGVKWDEYC